MKTGIFSALALALLAAGCGERPRPNVVLVSVDTLRADHLSGYGYERPTSPHIDALAAESVLFENAQAASSSTAPSHMTMLTGVLPRVHGIFNGTIHANTVKLQGAAKVDGEIFNKSLTIDPNVQFEGVSRRLERPVDAPKAGQAGSAKPEAASLAPRLVEPVI